MTPTERREMQRLRRQRDALLIELQSLVTQAGLSLFKGAAYAELHRDAIAKADRLCRRMRIANP